jgi:caffeoyl-CoA O-methyltransferase
MRLSRPGSIIVADNCIRGGRALREAENMDADTAGLLQYNKRASSDPRLMSIALPIDTGSTDGFTISVVLPEHRGS